MWGCRWWGVDGGTAVPLHGMSVSRQMPRRVGACLSERERERGTLAERLLQMPLVTELHRGEVKFLSDGSAVRGLEPHGPRVAIRFVWPAAANRSFTRSTQMRSAPAPARPHTWTRAKPLVVGEHTHGGCCLSPVLGDNQISALCPQTLGLL